MSAITRTDQPGHADAKESATVFTDWNDGPAPMARDEWERLADEHIRLATAPTDEPCRHGHFDCAETPGGPCSAESFAWLTGRGVDVDR